MPFVFSGPLPAVDTATREKYNQEKRKIKSEGGQWKIKINDLVGKRHM